jgi:hypothetical protein
MKKSFSTCFCTALTALAVSGVVMAPLAEAKNVGGKSGAGGHAARSGGGHADNSRRDARANNVRSTSVNRTNVSNRNTNVNVNKNVNVNVDADRHGGCCHGGWDDDYHPVATAAAVTATVAVTSAIVGSMVRTLPPSCVPVNYGGMIYQQCGTVWYQPQGTQYVVINAPY